MDAISVDTADRVLKYTSGRLPPLTELKQLTLTVTSELAESLPLLLMGPPASLNIRM